ncbi:MAG: YHS domain-containing protein [Sneathiella sp.]|nr:YHS domain-containing protein [Sneathiella sp.]
MSSLFYFLFWAGLIFLMMRFGCGAHVMGHKSKHKHSEDEQISPSGKSQEMLWVAPARDIDPVCGTQVNTKNAKSTVHNGSVYYLCSRECREIFEADPEAYLGVEKSKLLSSGPETTHA